MTTEVAAQSPPVENGVSNDVLNREKTENEEKTVDSPVNGEKSDAIVEKTCDEEENSEEKGDDLPEKAIKADEEMPDLSVEEQPLDDKSDITPKEEEDEDEPKEEKEQTPSVKEEEEEDKAESNDEQAKTRDEDLKEDKEPKEEPKEKVTPVKSREKRASPQKKETSSPQKKETSSSPLKKETPSSPQKKETSSSPQKKSPRASNNSTPMLEQPLERSGKRERATVQRFSTDSYASPSTKELEIPQGHGKRFIDIPFVCHMIGKTSLDDLKVMHRICFGRPGTSKEIRKNLMQFSGFAFTKDSTDYERKKKALSSNSYHLKDLKKICDVGGLEKSGTKEHVVELILDFILSPSDKGKKVPQKVASSSKKRKISSSAGKSNKKSKIDVSESDQDAQSDQEEKPLPKKSKKGTSLDERITQLIKDLLKKADLEKVTMKEMCKKIYDHFDEDLSSKKDFIKATVKQIISSQ